jgi:hypothetical protein
MARRTSCTEYNDGKLLMIFFTSNHCPTSHGVEARLKKFLADFRGKGLTFVAINPNHPDGLSIDELGYSKYNDSFEDMSKIRSRLRLRFSLPLRRRTQAVARAYGCLATPHVFLFDAARKLRYKGRFDDSRFAEESTVKSPDARNAVEALLAGKSVPVEVTQPHGCSTKVAEQAERHREAKERSGTGRPSMLLPLMPPASQRCGRTGQTKCGSSTCGPRGARRAWRSFPSWSLPRASSACAISN